MALRAAALLILAALVLENPFCFRSSYIAGFLIEAYFLPGKAASFLPREYATRRMSVKLQIIGCYDWGARKPKAPIETVPRSHRIIFHHTAGHHREIDTPRTQSRRESERYAKDIQAFHMSQGWLDSGHNFLVCRNGLVLQGRWLTVSAIRSGHMVHSAHCPGMNDQIGIEHEHKGTEEMTSKQREASARLMAWIADQYDLRRVLPVDPHSAHFSTACPANLKQDIPAIKRRAQQILDASNSRR